MFCSKMTMLRPQPLYLMNISEHQCQSIHVCICSMLSVCHTFLQLLERAESLPKTQSVDLPRGSAGQLWSLLLGLLSWHPAFRLPCRPFVGFR